MRTNLKDLDVIGDYVSSRGRQIYNEKLKADLVRDHLGRYVAIDPESENYFLGDTRTEALLKAHEAMPETLFYMKRIGYKATVVFGYRGDKSDELED